MKPFFIFTFLVLAWAGRMWDRLPLWIWLLVLVNVLVALCLATRKAVLLRKR